MVKSRVISRYFNPTEAKESSTFCELTAVQETWTNEVVLIEFEGQTVGHYNDNVAVVFILDSGSKQPKLQALAMDVFMSLRKYNITLCPVWISRDSAIIQWADSGSKDFHSDDYSLDPVSFQSLETRFGKFSVDCFTSAPNAVCDKFSLSLFFIRKFGG